MSDWKGNVMTKAKRGNEEEARRKAMDGPHASLPSFRRPPPPHPARTTIIHTSHKHHVLLVQCDRLV